MIPRRVDVLVAGSGAAGLTAALAAATEGADVLLVERADRLGGTTALSGGRIWVPGNHLQGDDPGAAAYLDGLFDDRYRHLTAAFLRTAPEMARFVEKHTPHRFVLCPTYPDYHQSRPGATLGGRALDAEPLGLAGLTDLAALVLEPPGYLPMSFAEWERWRYPRRYDWDLLERRQWDRVKTGGVALVAALLDGVVNAGVQVWTGTRLTGVRAGEALLDGTEIAARSVILATGGFDWDPVLRTAFPPKARRATGAPPTNTGDALRIAERAGARLDNLTEGWWMPMLAIPGETLGGAPFYRSLIRERGLPRQIMINATGRRFTDETRPYNEIGKVLNRSRGPVRLVFDAGYRARYPMPGVPAEGPVPPWVWAAGSARELAGLLGADPGVLDDTVTRWNAHCRAGADPDFGRGSDAYARFCGDPSVRPNPCLGPLDVPPYYAVEVLAGTIGTKGGPVTDADGAVLGAGDRPIPGLYAVGNAAAFWTGDGYPGPGATLAVGMTMGYRAGRHATATVR